MLKSSNTSTSNRLFQYGKGLFCGFFSEKSKGHKYLDENSKKSYALNEKEKAEQDNLVILDEINQAVDASILEFQAQIREQEKELKRKNIKPEKVNKNSIQYNQQEKSIKELLQKNNDLNSYSENYEFKDVKEIENDTLNVIENTTIMREVVANYIEEILHELKSKDKTACVKEIIQKESTDHVGKSFKH